MDDASCDEGKRKAHGDYPCHGGGIWFKEKQAGRKGKAPVESDDDSDDSAPQTKHRLS